MKKKVMKLMAILGITALFGGMLFGCQKKSEEKDGLKTVRLNEVVRSVFYAPMYVAINEGFFEDEGLKIDLSTGQGADATIL